MRRGAAARDPVILRTGTVETAPGLQRRSLPARRPGDRAGRDRLDRPAHLRSLSARRAPDSEYDQVVSELRAAIARWREAKRSIEESYATATEEAANQTQAVSPDVARKLRDHAQRLRREGTEAFRP